MWVNIPTFSSYQAGHKGHVRNKKTKRVLKPYRDIDGYLYVALYESGSGIRRNRKVSRLVAAAFLAGFDIDDRKQHIDHINRRRADNNLHNLRVVTAKQNSSNRCTTNHSKGLRVPVEQWTLDGRFVALHVSDTAAAKAVGGRQSNIGDCARGRQQTSHGYIWRRVAPVADLAGELWEQHSTEMWVSNKGRSKRVFPTHEHSAKDASTMSSSNGYPKVGNQLLHIIVAKLFLDPPADPKQIQVNHKDGNKLNADVSNLEWVTPQENSQHAHDNGLNKRKRPVVAFDRDDNEVARYPSIKAAEQDTGSNSICNALRTGGCSGNFRWTYL